MGSGKTTVGTLLARQLAWRFVDLDARIEEAAGLSIPEIFERLGETTFRQMEADQLRAALGRASEHKEGTVLALGGGTYAQAGCPEFLRAAGVTVLLTPGDDFSRDAGLAESSDSAIAIRDVQPLSHGQGAIE